MNVELDRNDLMLLIAMLDERVGTIRPEIRRTMNYEYRADLKDIEVRIKDLLNRFRDELEWGGMAERTAIPVTPGCGASDPRGISSAGR